MAVSFHSDFPPPTLPIVLGIFRVVVGILGETAKRKLSWTQVWCVFNGLFMRLTIPSLQVSNNQPSQSIRNIYTTKAAHLGC